MPRTRSAATPPPRRSGSDRPRSVRQLTHRPVRSTKKAQESVEVPQPELVSEPVRASKHELIQRHAEVRARQPEAGFGVLGIAIVVVICLAIGVAWWFLPNPFPKPEQIVASPVATTEPAPTSTVRFVPVSETTSTTMTASTERRLLLPLTPTTSTKRLK